MLLSIVTINRNNADGLEKTILSVAQQVNRSDFEYIVIDGASTDRSTEVIAQHQSQIDHWISEPDHGIYSAMNKALRFAHGAYLLFLNSGDVLSAPDVVQQVYAAGLHADFVFGCWRRVRDGQVLSHQTPVRKVTLYELRYRSECICHQATFTRTAVFRELGGYDESLRLIGDVAFLMYALVLGRKTQQTIAVECADFEVGGASDSGTAHIRQEMPDYFRRTFPALVDDYERMHKILRFTPASVKRHLLWRLRGNNY